MTQKILILALLIGKTCRYLKIHQEKETRKPLGLLLLLKPLLRSLSDNSQRTCNFLDFHLFPSLHLRYLLPKPPHPHFFTTLRHCEIITPLPRIHARLYGKLVRSEKHTRRRRKADVEDSSSKDRLKLA
jgi:hypothetical protein